MLRRTWDSPAARISVAFLLVLGSLLFRLWLKQWCPAIGYTFSTFYMAVILSSYFLGTVEAIVAVILSASLGYWALIVPQFGWTGDRVELVSLASFCLTSLVDIYLVVAMKKALALYKAERLRFEILAEGHAALFHDYNARTANYLCLLSVILDKSAKDAANPDMSLIDEASRHAFALSSLHREQLADGATQSYFLVFARQLLENVLRDAGASGATIRATGDNLSIPSDRAALLAIILAEWAHHALSGLARSDHTRLELHFRSWDGKLHLALRAEGCRQKEGLPPGSVSKKIVEVIVSHLGGRSYISPFEGGLSFELMVPIDQQRASTTSVSLPYIAVMPPSMAVN